MWVRDIQQLDIAIDNHYYAWLTKPQSLSIAMKQLCKDFTVEVVSQEIGRASADEQELLEIAESNSWIRQVYLCGDGERWSYGRVIVPHHVYAKHKQEFDTLGTKPLGETLLFGRSNVARSNFEYAQLATDHWARRSVFDLAGDKIIVMEGFLPAIPRYNVQPVVTRVRMAARF